MDTVLGVSMAPTAVRMVLVEGQNGDGATVDEDNFEVDHEAPTVTAADRVISAFGEFADAIAECEPGCSHLEAGCALDAWVAEHGSASGAARLDSLRRLLRSREGLDPAENADSDGDRD